MEMVITQFEQMMDYLNMDGGVPNVNDTIFPFGCLKIDTV